MSYRLVTWVPEVRFVGPRPKTRAVKPREKTRAQSSLIYACFSCGSLFKTWPKPETAHEKPLAPRVAGDNIKLKQGPVSRKDEGVG